MSFEFPPQNTEKASFDQRAKATREEAIKRIEAGDLKGALEIALTHLLPEKGKIDLSKEKMVRVDWEKWNNAKMGDPTAHPFVQEVINIALSFLESGEVEKSKAWLQAVLVPSDIPPSEPVETKLPVYRDDPKLQDLTPEACRKALVEQWIVSNPAIPDPAKEWTLKLVERFPTLFADPTTTEVKVVYDSKDQYGPSVTISYRTFSSSFSRSFREHHLK